MSGSQESSPVNGVDTQLLVEKMAPEVAQQWIQLRMGHEAMVLDKIQRQNRIVEDTVRGQQREAGYEVSGGGEDDEMGVSIGNEYNYNIQQAPPPAKSSLLKSALLVGAGVLGGAAPLAAMAAYEYLTDDTSFVDTDTDTVTDVAPGFGVPQDVPQE